MEFIFILTDGEDVVILKKKKKIVVIFHPSMILESVTLVIETYKEPPCPMIVMGYTLWGKELYRGARFLSQFSYRFVMKCCHLSITFVYELPICDTGSEGR